MTSLFSSVFKRKNNVELQDLQHNAQCENYQTLQTVGTYTIDEAIDHIGFGLFQWKLTFFVGLCWMADAMEIMILSILSPALNCEWRISTVQEALLTVLVFLGMMAGAAGWGKLSDMYGRKALVFLGMMAGAAGWGKLSDMYGRKASIFLCASYTVFYGVLSAFSPNYIWLLVLRALVGVGIGGVPQAVTIFSEFLPTSYRFAIAFIQVFWSCGTFIIVLAAVFIMPSLGWRYLVIVAAVPCFLFLLACIWMPESIRYDMAAGNRESALTTLRRVARDNGRDLPEGTLAQLSDADQAKERGRIRDLFKPEVARTTVPLWLIWIIVCFSYYGLVLMSTELYKHADECKTGIESESQTDKACALDCKMLTKSDYINLLWTSFAEFPGIILCLILMETAGRRLGIILQLLTFTVFTLALNGCLQGITLTVVIFIARSAITGAFQTLYVYTPEVYSTEVRAVGLGSSSAAARIGAIITPFIGQVLLEQSLSVTVCTYAGAAFLAAIAACCLPIETKGRNLQS